MNEQPLMNSGREKIRTVDVREDIRNGREPFSKIMNAVSTLKQDEQFRLIAPFEPAPLYAVLGKQGFQHHARRLGGDWEVLFTREVEKAPTETITITRPAYPVQDASPSSRNMVDVDARGLEPPQPLVTILEALATLPGDAELRARTDRRPMHLFPQLEQRGFVGETEEQTDGSYLTHIRRA
ncbi:MAG TPA: DUF2249 domain-containing protein [Verrucomicrobiae bacterium]|nr:DUF2249 domain-containing protein [Verrucomicrobiae bacterium]